MPARKQTPSRQSNSLLDFFSRGQDPSLASKKRKVSQSPRGSLSEGASYSLAVGSDNSCPVVISDDEGERTEALAARNQLGTAIHQDMPEVEVASRNSTPGSVDVARSTDNDGLRRRKSSRSSELEHRPVFGPLPAPSLPDPFPGVPNFKPPSTWPTIIPTGESAHNRLDTAVDADEAFEVESNALSAPSKRQSQPYASPSSQPVAEELAALEDEWNEGDEEGMGMDDPEDEGAETGTEVDSQSVHYIDVDLDFPGPSRERRRSVANGILGEKEEQVESQACPVCDRRFQPDQTDVSLLCHIIRTIRLADKISTS